MMYKLIRIEENPEVCILCFDPPLEIAADKTTAALKNLVGEELDEEEFEQLIETIARPAIEYAAKQLGMRPLTRKDLLKKLAEKGYDEYLAEYAADKLESLGGIDDYEYARIFAEDRSERGWGAVRIRNELRMKGVDAEAIEQALAELPQSEDKIERFIESRTRGELLDRKAAKKISDALVRRGFSWDEISPILARYME